MSNGRRPRLPNTALSGACPQTVNLSPQKLLFLHLPIDDSEAENDGDNLSVKLCLRRSFLSANSLLPRTKISVHWSINVASHNH